MNRIPLVVRRWSKQISDDVPHLDIHADACHPDQIAVLGGEFLSGGSRQGQSILTRIG